MRDHGWSVVLCHWSPCDRFESERHCLEYVNVSYVNIEVLDNTDLTLDLILNLLYFLTAAFEEVDPDVE